MSDLRGPFGWLSPVVAAITDADPEFCPHAIHMDGAGWHLLGLIMSQESPGAWQPEDWASFARVFRGTSRRELVRIYLPNVAPAFANVVGKLKGALWQRASYRRLMSLFAEPQARKWFLHAKRISRHDLHILSRLPDAYRLPAIVTEARKRKRLREIRYMIAIGRRVRPDLSDRVLARIIEHKGIKQAPHLFSDALIRATRFAPPPWAGDDRLSPITDWQELQRTALAMRNCIRTYLAAILEGRSYLYVYRDEAGVARAVVEIIPDAVFGWEFSEALGPNNDDLPRALYFEILRRLQAGGISAGLELPFAAAERLSA